APPPPNRPPNSYNSFEWSSRSLAKSLKSKHSPPARVGSRKSTGLKRTVSARKSSNASGTWTRRKGAAAPRVAVCGRNGGNEASLERNKIYAVLPDQDAERDADLRVVDESGEDYLFSADRFVAIDVPAAVRTSLLKNSIAQS